MLITSGCDKQQISSHIWMDKKQCYFYLIGINGEDIKEAVSTVIDIDSFLSDNY